MEAFPTPQSNSRPSLGERFSLSPRMLRPQTRARLERALPLFITPENQREAAGLATTPVKDGVGGRVARTLGSGALILGMLIPGILLKGGAGLFAETFRALDMAGVSPYATKTTPFDIKYFLGNYDRLTKKEKK